MDHEQRKTNLRSPSIAMISPEINNNVRRPYSPFAAQRAPFVAKASPRKPTKSINRPPITKYRNPTPRVINRYMKF